MLSQLQSPNQIVCVRIDRIDEKGIDEKGMHYIT